MAGVYYTKTTTKVLLDIASADTSDDAVLDTLGGLADQHIDNILKQHDEKIPLQSTNILNDIKQAADFYTASLYKGKREQLDAAKFWMDAFQSVIDGIIEDRSIDGVTSYVADRHNSRYSQSDIFELWN